MQNCSDSEAMFQDCNQIILRKANGIQKAINNQ